MYFMNIVIKRIPLRFFLLNITGCYCSFSDDSKTMNFILNDALLEKLCETFSDIDVKLGFKIIDFTSDNGNGQRFKTKVTDKTCIRRSNDIEENNLPWQKTIVRY